MLSELLVAGSVLLVLLAIVTVASLSAAAERFERRMQRAYQEGYESAETGHFGANLYAKADQPKLYERFEAGQRMGRHRKNWEEAEASAVSADAKPDAGDGTATETARQVQEAKDAVAAASGLVDRATEHLRTAYATIDRLRTGRFTDEEVQVLCRDAESTCRLLTALTGTSQGWAWLHERARVWTDRGYADGAASVLARVDYVLAESRARVKSCREEVDQRSVGKGDHV